MEISLGLYRPRTLLNLLLVPAHLRFGKPRNWRGLPHNRVGAIVTVKQASMFSEQRFALLRILAAFLLTLTGVGAQGGSSEIPLCDDPVVDFDPDNFSDPTRIYNKWLPLVPGTQLTLEGRANRGGGALPHQVVFTVTNLTKMINGVRTVVVWDVDSNEGQLVERELAFFAQDDDGNVWNLGEYPEEFEERKFVGASSTWIAGLDGAEGGIHMLAKPRRAVPRYLQGRALDIDFFDCAQVIKKGLEITVPFDSYKDVLLTDEISPLEPDSGSQRKFHAPGVGIIQVGAVDDPEGETLVLVKIVYLSTEELAEVRKKVLKLDRRAYRFSEVYADTPPAE